MKRIIATAGVLFLVFCVAAELYILYKLPSGREIKKLVTSAPRYIPAYTDRYGFPMTSRYTLTGQAAYTPLDSIPQHVVRWCVYFEDRSFWSLVNVGVNFKGLVRAVLSLGSSGGSSISMQLIKNASGFSERTFWRKWLEIHEAITLNTVMTKREIIETYFNAVPFGSGSRVGIGAASQFYFSKRPSELTPAEGLFLLTLLPLSTTDARTDLDRIYARYRARAQRLFENGLISPHDPHLEEFLVGPTLKIHRTLPSRTGLYLDRVAEEVYNRLGGMRYDPEFDGLQVQTTLDIEAQDSVAAILAEATRRYSDSYASFILMNAHNEIILYATSYPTLPGNFDILQSEKVMPSSRMKVYVYSALFEALLSKGYTEKRILEYKLPTVYKVSEKHIVRDLDGRPASLRVAIAKSLNSSAYYAGNEILKPGDIVSFMRRFGGDFVEWPSIPLGVQPWSEMKLCWSYNTILNREGFISQPSFVKRIVSRSGDFVLYDAGNSPAAMDKQVVSSKVSSLIKQCLREATSNGTSHYLMELDELASLDMGFKTGTSKAQFGVTGFVGNYTCSLLVHGKNFKGMATDISVPLLGKILTTLKRMKRL